MVQSPYNLVKHLCLAFLFAGLTLLTTPVYSQNAGGQPPPPQGTSADDLQKQTQNPVANLISVPFQNNTDNDIGPYHRDKNTLNIQPVIPSLLGKSTMLITRVIIPVMYEPEVLQSHLGTFGIGDIQPTFFFSPAKPGKLIWGVGPALLLPTASDDNLGSGKWAAGPSVVALAQPGKWTLGVLASNLWSYAGSSPRADVNSMTLQYFVNYNLKKGWFLSSSPILNANWNAPSHNVWLVPAGGGFGRVFKIGAQPMNASASYYYNVVRPDNLPSPRWGLRVQVALLFPRGAKK